MADASCVGQSVAAVDPPCPLKFEARNFLDGEGHHSRSTGLRAVGATIYMGVESPALADHLQQVKRICVAAAARSRSGVRLASNAAPPTPARRRWRRSWRAAAR